MKHGFVLAAIIKPAEQKNKIIKLVNAVSMNTVGKHSLKDVHDILGHPGKEGTQATAKYLGIDASGKVSNRKSN